MKAFHYSALTFGVACALDSAQLKYLDYLAKYGKLIESMEDFNERLGYFGTLDRYIEEHNAEDHSFKLGHNQFSDWSKSEYSSLFGYELASLEQDPVEFKTFDESANGDKVNWIKKGAVTGVMDQGYCNAGYAFAAVGALEGIYKIKTGCLKEFSKQ